MQADGPYLHSQVIEQAVVHIFCQIVRQGTNATSYRGVSCHSLAPPSRRTLALHMLTKNPDMIEQSCCMPNDKVVGQTTCNASAASVITSVAAV